MKSLTVYKASAGSGKTFRLAVEYISLVVKDVENESFKNILAVTFTNKATAEMKLRILSQLYGIARGLPSSDGYLDEVRKNVQLPVEEVRKRAAKALRQLTHNYNYFRVQTIDAFFQTVLRNLARELNLTANLRISLNDDDIESLAVDEMIQGLKPGAQVLRWISDYIQSNMDENRGWKVFKEIKSFGQNIFKEFYQQNRDKMNRMLDKPDFFDSFREQLNAIKRSALVSTMKPYALIVDELHNAGFDDKGLFNTTPNQLEYCCKGADLDKMRVSDQKAFMKPEIKSSQQKRMEKGELWVYTKVRKTPEGLQLKALAEDKLCELLRNAEENRVKQSYMYYSAVFTLANLNQLRLLRAIEKAVDDQNAENNRFLLCNTQHLLHTMIDGSDTPFIFEKIGAQLRHIMIDEFQDTSTVQWRNFKVLLDNCLAQRGSHSLIVGDVKQSIYRWRSGDWKLLNNIHESDQVHIEPLATNYRSSHRVIAFNNAFFVEAKRQECEALRNEGIEDAEQLSQAYDDVEQEAKKNEQPGRVEVFLIKQEGRSNANYNVAQLDALADDVCRMVDAGVRQSDIAILVRSNKSILPIADLFAHDERLCERGVRLVSDEAFRMDASVVVRLLVNALRVLSRPDDKMERASLVKNYQTYIMRHAELDDAELLMDETSQYLPPDFQAQRDKLVAMPLLDLVERLYEMFSLNKVEGQTAYVCAFHDQLAEYLEDHDADIEQLLAYWEETLCKKMIQCDDVEGIRILTIHKSKGLEYAHVIVPFCDWTLELGGTFWCQKEHPAPYDALPIVPVNFSADLKHSVYAADYREEHFQNVVDNLNLLYVAFTRAGKSLTILGKKDAKPKSREKDAPASSRSELLESVVRSLAVSLEGASLQEDETTLTFEYGEPLEQVAEGQASKKQSDNVFEQKPETRLVQVETFRQQVEFRQSNRSRDFVNDTETSPRDAYIQRGNVLHEIFSHIRTLDDVEPAIAQLTLDGVLTDNASVLGDLRKQVAQCLSQPEARAWFSPQWTLYNECTILTTDEQGRTIEHRPDRVMTDGTHTVVVDFKFGHPHPEYHQQVDAYARLLREMGMADVKAYLWYVTLGRVEEVGAQS